MLINASLSGKRTNCINNASGRVDLILQFDIYSKNFRDLFAIFNNKVIFSESAIVSILFSVEKHAIGFQQQIFGHGLVHG